MGQETKGGRVLRIADLRRVSRRGVLPVEPQIEIIKAGTDVASSVERVLVPPAPISIVAVRADLAKAKGRDRRGGRRPTKVIEGLGVTALVPSPRIAKIGDGGVERASVSALEDRAYSAAALERENVERVYRTNQAKYDAIPPRTRSEIATLIGGCTTGLLSIPVERLDLVSVIYKLLELFGNLQNRFLNDARAHSVLEILESTDDQEINVRRLSSLLKTFLSTPISGREPKEKEVSRNRRLAKIRARVELFPDLKPKITSVGSDIRKIPIADKEKAGMAISELLQRANKNSTMRQLELRDLCYEIVKALECGEEIFLLVADYMTSGAIDAGAIVPKKPV